MLNIYEETYLKSYKKDTSVERDNMNNICENIMNLTEEKILVTDECFNIVMSNSDIFKRGKNLITDFKFKKLRIKHEQKNILQKIRINNKEIWFQISSEKLKKSAKEISGYVLVIKDVTEDNKYKLMYENFLNFIKHDLKTPLIAQTLAIKLVMKNEIKPENKFMMQEILNSAETTYRMLKNRLQEIHLDNNVLSVLKKNVNISSLVQKINSDCYNFINCKNNKLEIISDDNETVKIDETFFPSAIINILYQVNERSKENSTISLYIYEKKDKIIFKISGDFEPINKKLFDKSELSKKEYERIGYNNGLYLAKRIINAHGGNIAVKKNSKKNRLIVIEIPN